MKNFRIGCLFVLLLAAASAPAFQPIPKASARALGVTRGKPFSSGAVFVNGKFLEAPYVVERWGTGIRINRTPVTGQVVDWIEFQKTQSGFKVTRTEIAPPSAPSQPSSDPTPDATSEQTTNEAPVSAASEVETAAVAASEAGASLAGIFGDDASDSEEDGKKGPVSAPAKASVSSTPSPRPKTVVSYSFEGDFVPNKTTKKLVSRINATRTEIDRILRTGGFICFGDDYSCVVGDKRTLSDLLDKLPYLQKDAVDEEDFCAKAGVDFGYLNEPVRRDLYKNRIDYLKLRKLRERLNDKFNLEF